MTTPSIKGIAITQLVEDVCSLRDQNAEGPSRLEARLIPSALALLDEKIQPTRWYPIDAYESLTELLCEAEGQDRIAYLRKRGAGSAERVLATGMYQQISFLRERYNPTDLENFKRELKLVVTLQGAFFNFTSWVVAEDSEHEGRLQIEIRDAEYFPEVLCHTTAGFVTRLAGEVRDRGLEWYTERPRKDLVILRMDRPPVLP